MLENDVLWVCRRLDQRNMVANHDGNVSLRLSDNRFLVTPTARGKGELTASDLIQIDDNGKTVVGHGNVFSEWKIHQAIYRSRPQTQCIVHAHPIQLTALGLQEKPLLVEYLPEALVSLGAEIPCIPLTAPGSHLQITLIEKAAPQCIAFLVSGNGIFAMGHDVKTAYFRIELAEHIASISQYLPKEKTKLVAKTVRQQCLEKHTHLLREWESQGAPMNALATDELIENIVSRVVASLQGTHNVQA